MKLERTLKQHANGVPSVIADGSKAQIIYCIQDAKKDIYTLAKALSDLVFACEKGFDSEEYKKAKKNAEEILK